jgi:hypothetical protein
MTPLTRKEIFSELKKLGITSTPELKFYLMEYHNYYVQLKKNACSPDELTIGIKDKHPRKVYD